MQFFSSSPHHFILSATSTSADHHLLLELAFEITLKRFFMLRVYLTYPPFLWSPDTSSRNDLFLNPVSSISLTHLKSKQLHEVKGSQNLVPATFPVSFSHSPLIYLSCNHKELLRTASNGRRPSHTKSCL